MEPEPALWDFFAISSDEPHTKLFYSISPLGVTLRANLIMHEVRPEYAHYGVMLIPFDPQYLPPLEDGKTYPDANFHYTDIALQHAVWHEAAHVIFEAETEGHQDALSAISYRDCFSRRLAPLDDDKLNTYFFIHEVIADSVSIFLKSEYVSAEAAEHHLALNEDMGGLLYRPVVAHFRDVYFENRHQRNFRQYLPELIAYINGLPSTDSCD